MGSAFAAEEEERTCEDGQAQPTSAEQEAHYACSGEDEYDMKRYMIAVSCVYVYRMNDGQRLSSS